MKTWLDLTEGFPIKFDVERMRREIAEFETNELWLGHYDKGLSKGWRAILLNSRHGDLSGPESQRPAWDFSEFRRTAHVEKLPYFKEVLDGFRCPQGRMRILRLAPGGGIGLHRDVGAEVGCLAFNQVRLHVPIITNEKVTFFVGGERIRMKEGRLYYVNFSKTHMVRNEGDEARLHLVMDLKVNDWLAQFFPKPSAWEQVEYASARATWPTFWKIRQARVRAETRFWKHYNGSLVQRTVHRLRGATD
jgi:hypothetical protein